MANPLLIIVGAIATALAIAGAVLPGLPTTPFLLVALWAFARSDKRLHDRLQKITLLRHGLAEAQRFEERGSIRLRIKLLALAMAWGSVAASAAFAGTLQSWPVAVVTLAALAGTAAMVWIPTDRET